MDEASIHASPTHVEVPLVRMASNSEQAHHNKFALPVSLEAASVGDQVPLPEAASRFVGTWHQVSAENYDMFLSESLGLSWPLRKVAMRVRPHPTWYLDESAGTLCCRVDMLGGLVKSTLETYGGSAASSEEQDENLEGVVWTTRVWWEDGCVLCSERRSADQNGGEPITVRRWIEPSEATAGGGGGGGGREDDCLVVTQQWAPGKVFTQRLSRA
jgi:hypothetical protein